MSDQVRIYSGDTVKVVSLDKNRGLTLGEGAAYQINSRKTAVPTALSGLPFSGVYGAWSVRGM